MVSDRPHGPTIHVSSFSRRVGNRLSIEADSLIAGAAEGIRALAKEDPQAATIKGIRAAQAARRHANGAKNNGILDFEGYKTVISFDPVVNRIREMVIDDLNYTVVLKAVVPENAKSIGDDLYTYLNPDVGIKPDAEIYPGAGIYYDPRKHDVTITFLPPLESKALGKIREALETIRAITPEDAYEITSTMEAIAQHWRDVAEENKARRASPPAR